MNDNIPLFDLDILNSTTIIQLIMKTNLSGIEFDPHTFFFNLQNRLFKIKRNSDDTDNDREVKYKIIKLLQTIPDQYKEYISTKGNVEFVLNMVANPDVTIGMQDYEKSVLIKYISTIHSFNNKIFKECHDKYKNNILMLMIKIPNYEEMIKMFQKTGFRSVEESDKTMMTNLFSHSWLQSLFCNFLLEQCGVDPNEKNVYGQSFDSFVDVDKIIFAKDNYMRSVYEHEINLDFDDVDEN